MASFELGSKLAIKFRVDFICTHATTCGFYLLESKLVSFIRMAKK